MLEYKRSIRLVSFQNVIGIFYYLFGIIEISFIIIRMTLHYMGYLIICNDYFISRYILCNAFIYININFSDTMHFFFRRFICFFFYYTTFTGKVNKFLYRSSSERTFITCLAHGTKGTKCRTRTSVIAGGVLHELEFNVIILDRAVLRDMGTGGRDGISRTV